MKISKYILVVVSVLLLGFLVNTGCKKGAQFEPADLGDMESPAAEAPVVSPGEPTVGEGAGFAITDVKLVLPNLEEVGVDSKRISRHAKIKVIYEGELGSDIELTLDGSPVVHTVLSNENGELLIKPNMPMHNLKMYEVAGSSFTVKAPGDINGDGLSDFIVGAPDFDNGTYKGAAYVFFGNPDNAYPSSYQDADVKMYVGTFDAKFGSAIALGDINGDGYDDIVVGAPKALVGGSILVFHGGEAIGGQLGLNDAKAYANRANGTPSDFGSLAMGDVNGDGFEDIIIGEPLADGPNNALALVDTGAVHIVFGKAGGVPSSVIFDDGPQPDGTISFGKMDIDQYIGESVAAADINGDGIDDIIVGAPGKVGANSGKVYILLGKNGLESSSYVAVDATLEQQGIDRFGVSVAAATRTAFDKDFILIGAKGLVYKSHDGDPAVDITGILNSAPFALDELVVGWTGTTAGVGDPDRSKFHTALTTINGQTLNVSRFGSSIFPAGDLNGDGTPDFLIGEENRVVVDQGVPCNGGAVHVKADASHLIKGQCTIMVRSRFGTAVAGGRIR